MANPQPFKTVQELPLNLHVCGGSGFTQTVLHVQPGDPDAHESPLAFLHTRSVLPQHVIDPLQDCAFAESVLKSKDTNTKNITKEIFPKIFILFLPDKAENLHLAQRILLICYQTALSFAEL